MAKGAEATNIFPNCAFIIVNFKLLSGNTLEDLLSHIKNVIGEEFQLELLITRNSSKFSKVDDKFDLISKSIKLAYENVSEVVPFIMVGGTDSIYFDNLSDNIYRVFLQYHQ